MLKQKKELIYVLECITPNHFYVGYTQNFSSRLSNHRHGRGAMFTKLHGVKRVIGTFEGSKDLERKIVVWLLEAGPQFTIVGGPYSYAASAKATAASRIYARVLGINRAR